MMRSICLFSMVWVSMLTVLSGCEIDMEDGFYATTVIAQNQYGDGTRATVQYDAELQVQLGQDAGGIAPDVLIFTICDDLLASAGTQPCLYPIETAARNNHFGGEAWSYASFRFQTPNGDCLATSDDTLVISGDLIHDSKLEFTLSMTSEVYFETYYYWEEENINTDPADCLKHYPYPVRTQISGTAERSY